MRRIKVKILVGVLFLFTLIVLLSGAGIFTINKLSHLYNSSVLNNYRSIDYVTEMNKSLRVLYLSINNEGARDEILHSLSVLDSSINLESKNITEAGEYNQAQNLRHSFLKLERIVHSILKEKETQTLKKEFEQEYKVISALIDNVYSMNMDAVKLRNHSEDITVRRATLVMLVISALCLFIAFPFIFYFPNWILTPLITLNEKILAISEGKYNQKLEVNRKDEIGALAASFNIMAEKLKDYEKSNLQSLLSEKKRLDSVIQNLHDGVIILDNDDKIIKMNKIALDITGLSESKTINKKASDLAVKNDLFRIIIKKISDEKNDEEKPLKIAVYGEEQYFTVETVNILKPVNGKPAEEIGKVILLNNVTLFQKRDAAKTNLIATVSHQLKTPLSSINLSLRLLEDPRIGALNDEQKKLIISLRQQSNRLSRVTNELLDFSQAETGNIKLNITSVTPEDIIDLSVTALMMIISEKNITLETEIEEGLPVIKADIEKTVWVLVNIIANAVRYTPTRGKIILLAKGENGFVTFSVKDEGPGISEKEKDKIFEKYVQVGKPSSGTGLGLAIAKEFVQSQGGVIGVRDNIDKGSEFYFKLPTI